MDRRRSLEFLSRPRALRASAAQYRLRVSELLQVGQAYAKIKILRFRCETRWNGFQGRRHFVSCIYNFLLHIQGSACVSTIYHYRRHLLKRLVSENCYAKTSLTYTSHEHICTPYPPSLPIVPLTTTCHYSCSKTPFAEITRRPQKPQTNLLHNFVSEYYYVNTNLVKNLISE